MAVAGEAGRSERGSSARTFGREIAGLGVGVVALVAGLAILSHDPAASGPGWAGAVGSAVAEVFVQSFGIGALLIPIGLLATAAGLMTGRPLELSSARLAAAAGSLVASATVAQLALGSWKGGEAGGLVGGFLHVVFREAIGDAGTWMLSLSVLFVLVSLATGESVVTLAARVAGAIVSGARRAVEWFRARRVAPIDLLSSEVVGAGTAPAARLGLRRVANLRREPPERRVAPVITARGASPGTSRPAAPRQSELPFVNGKAYCLPSLDLLDPPAGEETPIDEDTLRATARVLETKLRTFDIAGEVLGISPGPVITTYEFRPAPGIKVTKIVALADDLAMAMSAMSVRILAPIPGRDVVGIEVANARREKVTFRDVVSSDVFRDSPSSVTIAMGKDTTGTPVAADLARMPHLLVAGATGAGKSVFLNALITSILMRATPRDLRLVLIDPKMLELATFEEIPHLLVPVVIDAKPAVVVLNNLVREMERRYRLMREKPGVREMDGYNRVIAEEEAGRQVIELEDELEPGAAATAAGDDEDDQGGRPDEADDAVGAAELVHEHMPRLVVIIDELADLMMSRRDCEEPICRLAQKARAAGIHLVIATQRPSVDVITGLIKANFPARVSFQVATRTDSRTVLDAMGAERLLGEGDMLFVPPRKSRQERLHGAYVSDGELQRVSSFVRKQGRPQFRMELLEDPELDEESLPSAAGDEARDDKYDAAVQVVLESGKASISYVQRRLEVGYNRAARMIEMMEREGVVSAADHRGAREILLRRED